MKRLLITGSRDWRNTYTMHDQLKIACQDLRTNPFGSMPDVMLISGNADGADKMAEEIWAQHVGEARIERHPAKWETLGKAAGFIRNKEMVDAGADLCLAFWYDKSKGTGHTIKLAKAAGIETRIFYDYPIDPPF